MILVIIGYYSYVLLGLFELFVSFKTIFALLVFKTEVFKPPIVAADALFEPKICTVEGHSNRKQSVLL